MMTIFRGAGRSIYIGRDLTFTVVDVLDASCSVVVEHPRTVAVSGASGGMASHVERQYFAERRPKGEAERSRFLLEKGMELYIGRGVRVALVSVLSGEACFNLAAPRYMAVTRDDFSFDEHLAFQTARESRPRE